MASHTRGRVIVGGVIVVAAVAGGGVAWAATRSSGPTYRLASVARGNVDQQVTEVGTIASAGQATLSFPVSGTVSRVNVKLGDKVSAGRIVARLDTTSLASSVESAKSTVASAKQRLASDQDAETATSTTTASSSSTALTTDSATEIALVAAAAPSPTPTATPSRGAGGSGGSGSGGGSSSGTIAKDKAAVKQAQGVVISDQAKLDALLKTSAGDLASVKQACASSTVTFTTVSSADGAISGTIAGASGLPIALVNGTDAAGNPVAATTVGSDGSYAFGSAGDPLKASASYTVQLGDADSGVTATQTCTAALTQVQNDQQAVAKATTALTDAIDKLDAAIDTYYADVQAAAASSGSGGSGSGGSGSGGSGSGGSGSGGSGSGGSGSGGSGSGGHSGAPSGGAHSSGAGTGTPSAGTGSGSRSGGSGSGTTGRSGGTSSGTGTGTGSTGTGGANGSGTGSTTITAAQIAADQKAIDAAQAQLAVTRQDLDQAVLATPISGTVAAIAITAGASVSAGSSSSTITVIGNGQKKITTTVGIADIDLVKTGDPVSVTVDGVSAKLSGRVTLIGIMNTDGTSGTTTTYPVTILLDKTTRPLYDGAGATVAIDVGTKQNVLTVPTSAVHLSAAGSSVDVYSGGSVTVARVQTGIRGVGTTEITSGLKSGQRVVLAVVSAAIPSSNSDTGNRGGTGGLLGGTGGGAARFAGGGVGGPPGR